MNGVVASLSYFTVMRWFLLQVERYVVSAGRGDVYAASSGRGDVYAASSGMGDVLSLLETSQRLPEPFLVEWSIMVLNQLREGEGG